LVGYLGFWAYLSFYNAACPTPVVIQGANRHSWQSAPFFKL
jgi:hypothetical protein